MLLPSSGPKSDRSKQVAKGKEASLAVYFDHTYSQKIKEALSSKMSLDSCQTARLHNPENNTLHRIWKVFSFQNRHLRGVSLDQFSKIVSEISNLKLHGEIQVDSLRSNDGSIYDCSNSILLWLYNPLLGLGRVFSFLKYTRPVGLLGPGISPSQGSYLHTEQRTHRINVHRHPYLELDLNPRPQCLSGRRHFTP
jgi:hypothetical protein